MGHKFLTHYQVLGVSSTATEREIKIAYRKAARMSHPDRGGDPAEFRKVTEAFEVLGNAAQRILYDRNFAKPSSYTRGTGGTARRSTPRSATSDDGAETRTSTSGGTAFETRSSPENRNVAGESAIYVPAYETLNGEAPVLPRPIAAQPVHGVARKRGIFGASARMEREGRTAQLIMQQVLSAIPAARLINGLGAPKGNSSIDHVVFSGYRICVIGSMLVPDGAFRWDGTALIYGSRIAVPPALSAAARGIQDLFPECNVTSWVYVQSSTGNLYEPVIDYARGTEPDGGTMTNVANGARFVREVKHFLASGPSPNVVDVQLLSRLVGAMY